MAWDDVLTSITGGSGDILGLALITIFIGGLAIILLIGGGVWWWMKKRWNLRVEIKLPRSDGKIIQSEWGKGYYNSKRGVVFIKRPGIRMRSIPLMIFDVRRYLQGSDTLTVIQLSPEEYRPVLPKSFLEYEVTYVNEETGEEKTLKESILNIEVDYGKNKAWRTSFEEASKQAYSLSTFFTQFQTPIAIAIVLVAVFAGFTMLWTRVGGA